MSAPYTRMPVSATAPVSSINKDTLLKLRSLRQKHARKVATLCGMIKKAAKGLVAVEKAMDQEAIEIAGKDYKYSYCLTFEENGSNDSQIETDGFITTPDFKSVLKMATESESIARSVAEAKELPELPYEKM
jgi:hypothetical protein